MLLLNAGLRHVWHAARLACCTLATANPIGCSCCQCYDDSTSSWRWPDLVVLLLLLQSQVPLCQVL
jgi:hypothetical protein